MASNTYQGGMVSKGALYIAPADAEPTFQPRMGPRRSYAARLRATVASSGYGTHIHKRAHVHADVEKPRRKLPVALDNPPSQAQTNGIEVTRLPSSSSSATSIRRELPVVAGTPKQARRRRPQTPIESASTDDRLKMVRERRQKLEALARVQAEQRAKEKLARLKQAEKVRRQRLEEESMRRKEVVSHVKQKAEYVKREVSIRTEAAKEKLRHREEEIDLKVARSKAADIQSKLGAAKRSNQLVADRQDIIKELRQRPSHTHLVPASPTSLSSHSPTDGSPIMTRETRLPSHSTSPRREHKLSINRLSSTSISDKSEEGATRNSQTEEFGLSVRSSASRDKKSSPADALEIDFESLNRSIQAGAEQQVEANEALGDQNVTAEPPGSAVSDVIKSVEIGAKSSLHDIQTAVAQSQSAVQESDNKPEAEALEHKAQVDVEPSLAETEANPRSISGDNRVQTVEQSAVVEVDKESQANLLKSDNGSEIHQLESEGDQFGVSITTEVESTEASSKTLTVPEHSIFIDARLAQNDLQPDVATDIAEALQEHDAKSTMKNDVHLSEGSAISYGTSNLDGQESFRSHVCPHIPSETESIDNVEAAASTLVENVKLAVEELTVMEAEKEIRVNLLEQIVKCERDRSGESITTEVESSKTATKAHEQVGADYVADSLVQNDVRDDSIEGTVQEYDTTSITNDSDGTTKVDVHESFLPHVCSTVPPEAESIVDAEACSVPPKALIENGIVAREDLSSTGSTATATIAGGEPSTSILPEPENKSQEDDLLQDSVQDVLNESLTQPEDTIMEFKSLAHANPKLKDSALRLENIQRLMQKTEAQVKRRERPRYTEVIQDSNTEAPAERQAWLVKATVRRRTKKDAVSTPLPVDTTAQDQASLLAETTSSNSDNSKAELQLGNSFPEDDNRMETIPIPTTQHPVDCTSKDSPTSSLSLSFNEDEPAMETRSIPKHGSIGTPLRGAPAQLKIVSPDQAFSPDRSAVLVAREEQEGNESEDISTTANKSRRRRTRATEQVDTSNEDYSKLSIRERAKFKVAQVRAKMEEKARAKAQAKA